MTTIGQLTRYGVVGLSTNAALYLGYLLLTALGLDHKISMTIMYATGVLLSFAFNKKWTFRHEGVYLASFYRYVATYLVGYIFSLGMLAFFVDFLRFAHQLVQAILIFATAALLFLLQKYWVFRSNEPIVARGMSD